MGQKLYYSHHRQLGSLVYTQVKNLLNNDHFSLSISFQPFIIFIYILNNTYTKTGVY